MLVLRRPPIKRVTMMTAPEIDCDNFRHRARVRTVRDDGPRQTRGVSNPVRLL